MSPLPRLLHSLALTEDQLLTPTPRALRPMSRLPVAWTSRTRWFMGLLLGVMGVSGGLWSAEPATGVPDPAPAAATALPVRSVVLFTSGVGFFEHQGTVNGNATAELPFKADDINDVLKSLVLEDEGNGTIASIDYPSRDPIDKILHSFQVDLSGNPSLGDFLTQLRGAEVTATMGTDTFAGTILGLEKQRRSISGTKETVDAWYMTLLGKGGEIRSLPLDQVTRIVLADPALQSELGKALAALAQSRDQDKKPVVIHFQGQGQRTVRVGYVVAAPVWKVSYRLLLPASDAKDKPVIQGWAIVENQTGSDWNGIDLSLVSGRPVSFIEDLYQPLYVQRPVVQTAISDIPTPQSYDQGIDKKTAPDAMEMQAAPASPMVAGAAAPGAMMGFSRAGGGAGRGSLRERSLNGYLGSTIRAQAKGASVGEYFQYRVSGISLPRERSSLIPILTSPISATQVSIYDRDVLPGNPLLGVRLDNDTGSYLPAGPATVFNATTYVGDASVTDIPPGEHRLISYAIDQAVRILFQQKESPRHLLIGIIVNGVLDLNYQVDAITSYHIDNHASIARSLVIAHHYHHGYVLVDSPKPDETTETVERFIEPVAAKSSAVLTVTERSTWSESFVLTDSDLQGLVASSDSGALPPAVKAALAKASDLQKTLKDTEREMAVEQQRVAMITSEQGRMRQDMQAVNRNSAYYNRLLSKLDAQETLIEKSQSTLATLTTSRDAEAHALREYLRTLSVGLDAGATPTTPQPPVPALKQ